MAKHIKLRGELVKERWMQEYVVRVSLLEQTHFNGQFGPTAVTHRSSRFRHKGFSLVSDNWRSVGTEYKTVFYLCPAYKFNGRAVTLGLVNLERWEKIKATVEAYNKRYSEEP